jgi:hypothetical protein
MAFVAECNFCRLVLRGVPEERLGSSVDCPRCHNCFTLAPVANPEEVLARVAKAAATAPTEPAATVALGDERPALPQTALVEATQEDPPSGRKHTKDEAASPVAPAKKEAPQAPPPRPGPAPRFPNYPGVASFLLGCFAFLAGGVFHLGLVALALGLFGLLLGVLGFVFSWVIHSRRLFPALGMAVSLPALLLPLVLPAWLGLNPLGDGPRQTRRDGDAAAPLGGGGGLRHPAEGDTLWVDAGRDALHHDDVRLRIVSAVVGPAEFEPQSGRQPPRDRCLVLGLRLTNAGVTRKINYAGWGGKDPAAQPVLRDNRGKAYPLKTFAAGWVVKGRAGEAAIPPGKSLDDVLVFEAPPDDISYLRLELPAAPVGAKGQLRMEVPKRMMAFR